MAFRRALRVLGIVLLVLSLVALTWGLRSGETQIQSTELASSDLVLPDLEGSTGNSSTKTETPPSLEARLLELSWPKSLRLGDNGTIRLTVGLPASQASQGKARPAFYDAYNLVLQSHLDLSGVTRTPTGEVSQVMLPDQPVVFLWYLRSTNPGIFGGKVWLHLRFVPRSGGQDTRLLLAAQQVEINVVTLLGMSGRQARLFGSLGLALGLFLTLEGLLSRGLEQIGKSKKGL
jgi:hypothetical protein